MTDPLLSVFPPPLLRLILCGGDGLPAAYGPVAPIGAAAFPWTLIHIEGQAVAMYPEWPAMHLTALPVLWRLPLDHWRARLALVAAHLIDQESDFAPRIMDLGDGEIGLAVVGGDIVYRCWWAMGAGDMIDHSDGLGRLPDLPTLPAHLRDHDPAVALVLALYDVPEIRARIAP